MCLPQGKATQRPFPGLETPHDRREASRSQAATGRSPAGRGGPSAPPSASPSRQRSAIARASAPNKEQLVQDFAQVQPGEEDPRHRRPHGRFPVRAMFAARPAGYAPESTAVTWRTTTRFVSGTGAGARRRRRRLLPGSKGGPPLDRFAGWSRPAPGEKMKARGPRVATRFASWIGEIGTAGLRFAAPAPALRRGPLSSAARLDRRSASRSMPRRCPSRRLRRGAPPFAPDTLLQTKSLVPSVSEGRRSDRPARAGEARKPTGRRRQVHRPRGRFRRRPQGGLVSAVRLSPLPAGNYRRAIGI